MAVRILADSWRQPARADDELLMTTTHAAQFLGITRQAMRKLGRAGVVPSVATSSPRIRLFKKGVLRRVNGERAEARLCRAQRRLAEVQPVMLKAGLRPRQFDLFGPKLRIVDAAPKNVSCHLTTHYSASARKTAVSDKAGYVAPAAGGSRR